MSEYIYRENNEELWEWEEPTTEINALTALGGEEGEIYTDHSIPDSWYENIVARAERELSHMQGWFVPAEQLAAELARLERLAEAEG